MKLKIYTAFFLILALFGNLLAQEKSEKIRTIPNYYKINKAQREVVEFYLSSRFFYPFGKVRSSNKMYFVQPTIVAVDKGGKVYDFDSYKSLYREAIQNKQDFAVNLFYLDHFSIKGILSFNYTILEPDWEEVAEVKEYELLKDCPVGCEDLLEKSIRKIHTPPKTIKIFNRKIRIYCSNDYD